MEGDSISVRPLLAGVMALLLAFTQSRVSLAPDRTAMLLTPGGWTGGPTLIHERAEIAAAELDGRLYVGGGFDPSGTDLASFEVFDPAVGVWVETAPMPRALNHLGIAAVGGLVYVAGGSAGSTPTSGLFAYDPAADAWTARADLPVRRSAHALVAAQGRLVVVGGVGDRPGLTLVYDPATDTWEERTTIPTLREHLSATAWDGLVYVMGGRWGAQGNLSTAEAYDVATDTWTTLTSMPTERGGLTAAAVDGRIHVLGGEAFNPNLTFPEHDVYDTRSGAWLSGAPLPTPRHGLGAAALGGQLFVIGGGRQAGLSASRVVEVFAPEIVATE